MKIEFNDLHEELAIEWQYSIILLLKSALEKHNINPKVAKDIVGDFVFNLSNLQDQKKIVFRDENYTPMITFWKVMVN